MSKYRAPRAKKKKLKKSYVDLMVKLMQHVAAKEGKLLPTKGCLRTLRRVAKFQIRRPDGQVIALYIGPMRWHALADKVFDAPPRQEIE